MGKKKEELWTEFAGKEFYAKMAENSTNDENGNDIVDTYSTKTELAGKVDQVEGKGLSTNDYTTAEKNKLGTVEEGAEVNVIVGLSISGTVIQPDQSRIVDIPVFGGSGAGMVPGVTQQDEGKYLSASGWDSFNFATSEDIDDMFTEPFGTVNIGGRAYEYVRINNQFWLRENLDYKFDGCTVGAEEPLDTVPLANYYNRDEDTYGINGNKYGLLYNYPAVLALDNLLTDGWHVPTKADFQTLIESAGGLDVAGLALKSSTGWSYGEGNDTLNFSAYPAGHSLQFNDVYHYGNVGYGAYFWSSTLDDSDPSDIRAWYVDMQSGNNVKLGTTFKLFNLYSVRLVKNLS